MVILAIQRYFLKDFIYYLFLETGREGERRETSMGCLSHAANLGGGRWGRIRPTSQACAQTGSQTDNLLLCSRMPNPLSHTSQGSKKFS